MVFIVIKRDMYSDIKFYYYLKNTKLSQEMAIFVQYLARTNIFMQYLLRTIYTIHLWYNFYFFWQERTCT